MDLEDLGFQMNAYHHYSHEQSIFVRKTEQKMLKNAIWIQYSHENDSCDRSIEKILTFYAQIHMHRTLIIRINMGKQLQYNDKTLFSTDSQWTILSLFKEFIRSFSQSMYFIHISVLSSHFQKNESFLAAFNNQSINVE